MQGIFYFSGENLYNVLISHWCNCYARALGFYPQTMDLIFYPTCDICFIYEPIRKTFQYDGMCRSIYVRFILIFLFSLNLGWLIDDTLIFWIKIYLLLVQSSTYWLGILNLERLIEFNYHSSLQKTSSYYGNRYTFQKRVNCF